MQHEFLERNTHYLVVLIIAVISVGGLIEILPLVASGAGTDPLEGVEPYPPLSLAGRDVYVSEGCYVCHSQQVRPFRSETERYGPYSVAGESVYDRPFQFGSKRTGPDLARVGGRYSDEWHRIHMLNPRDLVPESNMPAYPWLAKRVVDADLVVAKMQALQLLGDPYSAEDIAGARDAVAGKTELDALIAYLQGLGLARSAR